MVVNDPIADMLTRIRNAQIAIARILLEEGYIKAYDRIDDGVQGQLKLTLKYVNNKQQPVIAGLKRISKPGLRVYAGSQDGLMTDKKARQDRLGGEVLAYIW